MSSAERICFKSAKSFNHIIILVFKGNIYIYIDIFISYFHFECLAYTFKRSILIFVGPITHMPSTSYHINSKFKIENFISQLTPNPNPTLKTNCWVIKIKEFYMVCVFQRLLSLRSHSRLSNQKVFTSQISMSLMHRMSHVWAMSPPSDQQWTGVRTQNITLFDKVMYLFKPITN